VAFVARQETGNITAYAQYGPGARLALGAYAWWFSLWKFIWPTDLSPMYELPRRLDLGQTWALSAVLGVAVITIALVLLRRRWPGGLAAWAHSIIVLAPISGVVHSGNQLAADRYTYLSSLGFAVLAGADMVSAITMNYVEEAIGIARAAQEAGMPVAISFTVETDGRLPTGQPLQDAIQQVDEATGSYPAYYMLNCAHPEHFEKVLEKPWARRIRGLRANASRKSHAELNESTELDIGNPAELGVHYATLKCGLLPNLNVVGGCCGTDHRHVQRMAAACAPLFRVAA